MIALQMTDYERGLKSPAEFIAKPEPKRGKPKKIAPGARTGRPKGPLGPQLTDDEAKRRRGLLFKAIEKSGGMKTETGKALGIGETTIGRWAKGHSQIHDKGLKVIEDYLAEGQAPGLRRGHGVEWCPVGAHYVPEGKMRINENGIQSTLTICRDCQIGNPPKASREVQAELEEKIQ